MRLNIRILLGGAAAAVLLSSCASAGNSPDGASKAEANDAPAKVMLESSLVGYYGEPTLAAFARSSFVSKIVVGQVVATRSVVYEDATVYTEVTIQPDNPREAPIATRETGGVVTFDQVRDAFEGHVSDAELARRADEKIEFVDSSFPVRSEVGQHVLVMLSGEPTDPGGYFTAARLVVGKDQRYAWPATPPNERWAPAVDAAAASDLARLK